MVKRKYSKRKTKSKRRRRPSKRFPKRHSKRYPNRRATADLTEAEKKKVRRWKRAKKAAMIIAMAAIAAYTGKKVKDKMDKTIQDKKITTARELTNMTTQAMGPNLAWSTGAKVYDSNEDYLADMNKKKNAAAKKAAIEKAAKEAADADAKLAAMKAANDAKIAKEKAEREKVRVAKEEAKHAAVPEEERGYIHAWTGHPATSWFAGY